MQENTMSATLRIGELAARTGKSIHALRYYESLGLIPFVQRDAGGRRMYNPQHVEWLLFLDRLQRTGMSLSQMQQYAMLVSQGKRTLDARVALLRTHLQELERQMADLASSRALLLAKLDFYEDWQSSGKRPAHWWVDAPGDAVPGAPGRSMEKLRGRRGR